MDGVATKRRLRVGIAAESMGPMSNALTALQFCLRFSQGSQAHPGLQIGRPYGAFLGRKLTLGYK
jgi:hypothetical protein